MDTRLPGSVSEWLPSLPFTVNLKAQSLTKPSFLPTSFHQADAIAPRTQTYNRIKEILGNKKICPVLGRVTLGQIEEEWKFKSRLSQVGDSSCSSPFKNSLNQYLYRVDDHRRTARTGRNPRQQRTFRQFCRSCT